MIKKNGGEEMYEKITAYLDFFGRDAIPESELQEKTKEFSVDFMQSGFMVSNAMEAMGERAWASKSQLREDALAMTAEEACVCISAFIQQESFIPGVLADLVRQDVLPGILKRLRELDA